MLRLREVKLVKNALDLNAEPIEEAYSVVFAGKVGTSALVEITLHVAPRPTDAEMLTVARRLLSEVVGQVHHELAAPG